MTNSNQQVWYILDQRDEVIYFERQRFRQIWVWFCILIGPTVALWLLISEMFNILINGANPGDILIPLAIFLIIGVMFPLLFYITGLDTQVRKDGLYIRFKPIHLSWVIFRFADMKSAEAVTYNPLREYGGWGIRYGGKGKAYNVSGNKGVMINLKKGNSVLIGSLSHEPLADLVNENLNKAQSL